MWSTQGINWAHGGGTSSVTVSHSGTWTTNGNGISFGGTPTLNLSSGGQLIIPSVGLPLSGTLNFNGGQLTAGAAGTLVSGGNVNLNGPADIFTNFASTVSTAINGVGGLTKLGSGAPTLSNINNYNGATTVSGGTLSLSAASSNNIPNSSSISIAAGAGLNVSGLTGGTIVLGGSQPWWSTGPGTAYLKGSLNAEPIR